MTSATTPAAASSASLGVTVGEQVANVPGHRFVEAVASAGIGEVILRHRHQPALEALLKRPHVLQRLYVGVRRQLCLMSAKENQAQIEAPTDLLRIPGQGFAETRNSFPVPVQPIVGPADTPEGEGGQVSA